MMASWTVRTPRICAHIRWRSPTRACSEVGDMKPFVSHEIFFGIILHQARLWGSKQCTLLFPAIMGPPSPNMPPGLPQSQLPLLPPFAQPQGGLHETSYHLDASSIQQLIDHATSTHITNSTGKEKKRQTDRISNYWWQKRLE